MMECVLKDDAGAFAKNRVCRGPAFELLTVGQAHHDQGHPTGLFAGAGAWFVTIAFFSLIQV
jgi:hypothetical protein